MAVAASRWIFSRAARVIQADMDKPARSASALACLKARSPMLMLKIFTAMFITVSTTFLRMWPETDVAHIPPVVDPAPPDMWATVQRDVGNFAAPKIFSPNFSRRGRLDPGIVGGCR
jgi:hypothetical protein